MYQQIIVVGNLGRDPEMRFTPKGTPVTNLSVATNRKYTGADGQAVKETVWFRVSVFGKAAEACAQYLKKGGAVLVEGRLQPDKETGGPRVYQRPDGTHSAQYEVFANTVRFLGGGNHAEAEPQAGQGAPAGDEVPVVDDNEIPF